MEVQEGPLCKLNGRLIVKTFNDVTNSIVDKKSNALKMLNLLMSYLHILPCFIRLQYILHRRHLA